jgi:hypothetical protein
MCSTHGESVTTEDYREMALALPETAESSHMDHPDFRVRGKIFATILSPAKGVAMIKLTPEQQKTFMKDDPTVFTPAAGAWGARGATMVDLARAREAQVRRGLELAWRNVAPKRLVA